MVPFVSMKMEVSMKRSVRRFLTFLIAVCVLLPSVVVPADAVEEDPTIRIGLYYGNNAMSSANLENYSGSGYRFGWWNNDYDFVEVGSTGVTTVTTMKDKNMYLSGGLYYDTPTAGSYETIGAYHIQMTTVYASYEEAVSAAATFTSVNAFPAYINGEYRVRAGNYSNESDAWAAAAALGVSDRCSVVGPSTTCYTVTITKTTTILFEFDYGTRTAFGISPDITGVADPETWFRGYRYYGGFEYKRLSGDNITVINYVSIHDYVKGVLPYEMGASWPLEALKAQALCAKSYTLCNLGRHASSGFDLCNTTDCQVYHGTSLATANSDLAVDSTYGQFVLYQGQIAQTFYFSCDGGATEDAANVWGKEVPYLKGVIDPYESVDYTWSFTFSLSDLTWLVNAKGYSIGNIVDCYVSKTTALGNVYSVTFIDSSGRALNLTREAARSVFYSETLGNTNTSQRFTITPNYEGTGTPLSINGTQTVTELSGIYAINGSGEVGALESDTVTVVTGSGTQNITASATSATPVSFTINGRGLGHNVGMSQWGAYAMAQMGFTYDQILQFYFTGVTIGN